MTPERKEAIEDCAIECDGWAECLEGMIVSGRYPWLLRPLRRLQAEAEAFAYRNAAAACRELLENGENDASRRNV